MQWFESVWYPLQHGHLKRFILLPGLAVTGGLVYGLLSGGGFLYVVGIKTISLGMAAVPLAVALLFTLCLLAGWCWEVLKAMQENAMGDHALPDFAPWRRYVVEGAQLLLFYGLLATFLVSMAMLLGPLGGVVPVLLVVLHPLLGMPMLFSTHDKSFLGLMDGCLDAISLAENNYFHTWLSCTLYLFLAGGLFYAMAALVLAMSGLGLFCLPGLACMFLTGYGHLLMRLCETNIGLTPAWVMVQPGGADCVSSSGLAVMLPSNPFAMGDLPGASNPWRQESS